MRQLDPVTVGVDIGTTSVKAVAVGPDGVVLRRARVAHPVRVPAPGRLEHDARCWIDGVVQALGEVAVSQPAAVAVSALSPTITAVGGDGAPLVAGVLYDDERARGGCPGADPTASGEGAALLAWAAGVAPTASGYWPAQAVANQALGGVAAVDYSTACSMGRLFDGAGWAPAAVAAAGADPATLPAVAVFGEAIADRPGGGALVAGGVDAFCEQLVAGADGPDDALVVLGSTLVTWAGVPDGTVVPGLFSLPRLPSGTVVGGPSNAGGLFVSWVDRLVGGAAGHVADSRSVPVWWPHPRGERVPLHDPGRRAVLGGLDLTVGPAAVRRAAREATGFVVRHVLEVAGADPSQVVVTGGGVRDRAWLQALADVLGRPVRPVAVPEGAALGAAFLARAGVGLDQVVDAGRWARHGTPVDPDPAWVGPAGERYARYRDGLTGPGVTHGC